MAKHKALQASVESRSCLPFVKVKHTVTINKEPGKQIAFVIFGFIYWLQNRCFVSESNLLRTKF